MSFFPPTFFSRRSIARDLALGLTGIIVLITLILIILYQAYSNRQLAVDTEAQAEQIIAEAGNIFFLPLYNFDNQTLQHIARVYLDGNDFVCGITIKTEYNDLLFNEVNGPVDQLIRKDKVLYAKNKEIGTVTLYFSNQKLREQQRDTIKTGVIVILVLLIVMLAAMALFMRIWLKKPLHLLTNGIRKIASGDYTHPLPPAPQQEVNAIIDEVNTMAHRIAEQKKQLEDSEKRYRSIFEGAMEGIFQESPEGSFLTANPAMAKIFGYDSPEELMHSCTDTARQLYIQPRVRQQLMHALETEGFVTNLPLEMRHRKGHVLTIAMTARFVCNEKKEPIYIEGLVSDISRQQQMEAELRQAQKMEAIGTLAGGIAHDFNNILSAIFGYIELADMQAKNDGKLREHLANALAGARRARDLVQQILTFSRKADHQKKPFPLAIIVKEACKLLRSSIPATVEITRDIQSRAVVIADPTQIHQLVMNLCTNSYHAMENTGGSLTIRLYDRKSDKRSQETEDTAEPDNFVVLEITDTGSGMDEETRSKIFEPYFTTKAHGKGTGLGLALVHGIVSNCHGKIEVTSAIGKGTTFRIFLPAVEQKAKQAAGSDQLLPRGNGQKIMLVDDEEPVREILSSFLEESGYTVYTFSRGREILDALRENPDNCELLITDMAMPKMNGAEIARAALSIKPELPVILCTGYSADLSRQQALEIGIRSVIQKPIQRTRFLYTIYEALADAKK